MDRGRDFADIVYTLLVVEKRKRIEDVADAIGMSYAVLHARLINRTCFSADEVRALIVAIADHRLVDYFLAESDFIAVARSVKLPSDRDAAHPLAADIMAVQHEAARVVIDATDVLDLIDAGALGGRIDQRVARLTLRAIGATERALAALRVTLRSLK